MVGSAGSHGADPGSDPLGVVLWLAGLGSAVVVGLALVALARRRSWPYFLVAAALGTLLARTSLGALSMTGTLPAGTHHLPEHALDVLMVVLLLGAIYTARTTPGGRGTGPGNPPDAGTPPDTEDPPD